MTDDDVKQLSIDTKRALLTGIKEAASGASAERLAALSYAYAMLVGAKWGHLPGTEPLDAK